MKPSDLRRDAYTWSAIGNSAKSRAESLESETDAHDVMWAYQRVHEAVTDLVTDMSNLADFLEARDAS